MKFQHIAVKPSGPDNICALPFATRVASINMTRDTQRARARIHARIRKEKDTTARTKKILPGPLAWFVQEVFRSESKRLNEAKRDNWNRELLKLKLTHC
jgi:hypothetical protein